MAYYIISSCEKLGLRTRLLPLRIEQERKFKDQLLQSGDQSKKFVYLLSLVRICLIRLDEVLFFVFKIYLVDHCKLLNSLIVWTSYVTDIVYS